MLDLASGEGFGAAILAESAADVVGVEIDERTVEHARLNYGAPNLAFEVGDAHDLSRFAEHSFGVVVAFEMIEHVAQQKRVLDEVTRVLEPNGLLVISTPDRAAYTDATGQVNPFHVHELRRDEFATLLQARFENTATWGQRTITGSALAALDDSTGEGPSPWRNFFIERTGEEWRVASGLSPMYIIALASNAQLPAVPAEATLGDCGLQLVRAVEADSAARLGQAVTRNEALERQLREKLAEQDAHHEEVTRLRARAASDAHTISSLDMQLNATRRQVLRIEQSVTWQLFQRARAGVFSALGGDRSRGVAALQATLRAIGRGLGGTRGGSAFARADVPARARSGRIELPEFERPEVSIVIPLYEHAELTRAALESIRDYTEHVTYEVIVVDDGSDPATKSLLGSVRGARIIANETNLGYLRSVHRGTSAARGRWLVLCNNDIEVRPGWLAALVECGESRSDIAIVAPKYLYPDGSLAEAGGIVWRDGTGANYGRGDDPTCCHYEYRREIDYGSAAALMVKADFWREVGGFDERFLPMYYEDADLCFEARAGGLRVMFEPRARVIHVEGATAGVDEAAGHKRYQLLNRPKFVEKWHERLNTEHVPNDPGSLWTAANLRRSPHVLVVDHRMLMWDRDAGSVRMLAIIEALIELGCHVTFLPDNMVPVQPYARELQRMGVEVLYGIDVAADGLARIGRSLSLAILSRPQPAGRWIQHVREHAPSAMVVYDTVDLHWLREARGAAIHAGWRPGEMFLSPKARGMRELELAAIRATDVTLVVSESERAQVHADVPESVVHVVPTINKVRVPVPPAHARAGVLFVGGFEHPPNVGAALRLVNDVMPLVWRELPEIRVTFVGVEPPPEVEALASPLVDIKGWVQDLDPILDSARALVAPLNYGAGLKGKITQAFAVGLPVLTTPIGAEGLDLADGEDILIGETSEELAERVIALMRDDDLWQRLSRAGQRLATERYSPAVVTHRLGELLQEAAAGELAPGDAKRPMASA